MAPDISAGLYYGQTHHSTHTKPRIFKMPVLYDRLLLIQASIDYNKVLIYANKEYFDDKMKKLWGVFDKIYSIGIEFPPSKIMLKMM